MRDKLKKLNILAGRERSQLGRNVDTSNVEDQIEELCEEIKKDLNIGDGYTSDQSDQAYKLFADYKLATGYSWYLGNGDWC